jgi:uncharacterized protein (DUF1501 family)
MPRRTPRPSRRAFLASSGLAALSASLPTAAAVAAQQGRDPGVAPQAPFDSLRD